VKGEKKRRLTGLGKRTVLFIAVLQTVMLFPNARTAAGYSAETISGTEIMDAAHR
jgi:hypothetical protein